MHLDVFKLYETFKIASNFKILTKMALIIQILLKNLTSLFHYYRFFIRYI